MKALSKAELESTLAKRFGTFSAPQKVPVELLSSGIPAVDLLVHGLPRGCITEVFGKRSSGRTSFLIAVLAYATALGESCALIDVNDRFDPESADASAEFERLLWVCCRGDVERAFKATDLVLQSGGFGVVVLDMADVKTQFVQRIISTWWYRFRRAIESTPAAMMVISQAPCVRSCATVSLELKSNRPVWSYTGGKPVVKNTAKENSPRLFLVSDLTQQQKIESRSSHSVILRGNDLQICRRKPLASDEPARFTARA